MFIVLKRMKYRKIRRIKKQKFKWIFKKQKLLSLDIFHRTFKIYCNNVFALCSLCAYLLIVNVRVELETRKVFFENICMNIILQFCSLIGQSKNFHQIMHIMYTCMYCHPSVYERTYANALYLIFQCHGETFLHICRYCN